MYNVTGELVYKYVLRKGKLFVHEGEISIVGRMQNVYFKDRTPRVRCPKRDEFGVVQSDGPSLWLGERDDELAKQLFIEFEEAGLAKLQEQIRIKSELIKALKENSV